MARLEGAGSLEVGKIDSILQIKSKAKTTGFSFLGLFGGGTVTAEIEGVGAKIVRRDGKMANPDSP
jgi:hypothetical protein